MFLYTYKIEQNLEHNSRNFSPNGWLNIMESYICWLHLWNNYLEDIYP